MTVHIAGWMIPLVLTAGIWSLYSVWLWAREPGGIWDFMPAMVGAAALASTIALWIGVMLGTIL